MLHHKSVMCVPKVKCLVFIRNTPVTPLEIWANYVGYLKKWCGDHFLILNRILLFVCWPSRAFLFHIDISSLFVSASLVEPSFLPIGHVNNIPTVHFSLEFPEILDQNLIGKAIDWLSLSGISITVHCGILINIPYWLCSWDWLTINLWYRY